MRRDTLYALTGLTKDKLKHRIARLQVPPNVIVADHGRGNYSLSAAVGVLVTDALAAAGISLELAAAHAGRLGSQHIALAFNPPEHGDVFVVVAQFTGGMTARDASFSPREVVAEYSATAIGLARQLPELPFPGPTGTNFLLAQAHSFVAVNLSKIARQVADLANASGITIDLDHDDVFSAGMTSGQP